MKITIKQNIGTNYKKDLAKYLKKTNENAEDVIALTALLIETEAKKLAPINKQPGVGGVLRSSIIRKVSRLNAIVGTNVKYASDVEYGTVAHTIKAKNGKGLSDGKNFFGKEIQHPGTKAQPFLRPAFDKEIKELVKRLKKAYR